MAILYFPNDKVCTLRDRVSGAEEDFIIEAPNGEGTFEIDIEWIFENSYVDGDGLLQTPYNEGYIILRFNYSSHHMQLYKLLRADEIDIPYSFNLQNDQIESFVLVNEEVVENFLSGLPIQSLDPDNPYPHGGVTLEFACVSPKSRREIENIVYYADVVARPNRPSGLSANASEGGITVNWNDNPDSVDYYKLYFAIPGKGSSFWRRANTSDYGLDEFYPGEEYIMWVTAVRDGMESLRSSRVSVITPEPEDLASPTGLVATGGNGEIIASVDPYPVAVDSYNWYLDGDLIDTTTVPNYTYTGLTDKEYNVQCSVTVGGQESLRASTTVDLSSVFVVRVTSEDSPFNISGQDLIIVDASGGNVILNLPALSTGNEEEICIIKEDYTDNIVEIVPAGTELLSGMPKYALTNPKQSTCIQHEQQEWYLI